MSSSGLRSGLPRNEGTLPPAGKPAPRSRYKHGLHRCLALHHRYTGACPEALRGNADNRITEVESSADAQNWHHDARYFYSRPEQRRRDPHGPLQRVELGEHLVQGTDYAYTLQGWLKGINGDRLNPTTDMGRDGDATVVGNPNLLTGRDAYALSLGYYGDGDYKAIASAYDSDIPANVVQRPFAPMGTSGTLNTEHTPLYNGNIAHTVNTLQHFGLWDATNGDQGQVLAMVYRYDQLNRLRKARGVIGLTSTNTWHGVADSGPNEDNRYRSEYTYDANGNILSANRWDYEGDHYDEFAYKYQRQSGTARLLRNRLYQLFDEADPTNLHANSTPDGSEDIGFLPETTPFDEEAAELNGLHNYHYDALGNLIHDEREQINVIEWTVAGKVKSVSRTLGSTRDPLSFGYGASGQRILKQVGTNPDGGNGYREHYIRDAQGNIMATYRYTNSGSASLKLNERPLYGSSRLGSLRKEVELHTLAVFDPASANPVQMVDLNYELTDHLGNVCAVVTGRLLDGNGGGTAKQAELVSAQGYEAFGSLLPGRNYSSDSYRFGFQGQEKDDEINGSTGTSYAFEYRIHDPRVGRFLSIDPLAAKYPHNSPYAFSENRVVASLELEGLEAWDMNSHDPNYQMMTPEQREQFRDNAQKPAFEGILTGSILGELGVALRGAWLIGGRTAMLKLLGKRGVEEGATQAVERITGIPMVVSPMDVLQAARKGGRFIGNLSKMEGKEAQRAAEYLEGGSTLERIDRGPGKTADFIVDGKVTEFKSLDPSDAVNHSTAVTRLQAGAGKEGVQVIDLDMRPANGTASDARSVYDRFAGSPKGKSFLEGGGQVRIATSDGVLTYTGQ